jgi:rubrerythrin
VASVERYHERRYVKLLNNVQLSRPFKRDTPAKWKCRNCGYIFDGKEVPDRCPVCDHPKAYFELWCENY